MNPLNLSDVVQFVESNIGNFHKRKAESLKVLQLAKVLKHKNPYLFKAKNIVAAQDLVKGLLDAHLSSQEETIFGEFLEDLAIFVCGKVYGGRKSTAEGIDLEFDRDGFRYIVSVKSGPNWGNSSQVRRMRENFRQAQRIFRLRDSTANIVAINGCCYGKNSRPDKGDYRKICGQNFWEFISGNDSLYVDIVEPLGHRAKERNDEFAKEYGRILNLFTEEFIRDFCVDGNINWGKLVEFNSGRKKIKLVKAV